MSTERSLRVPPGTRTAPELRNALGRWQAEVVEMDSIDLPTTEMVRLRAAKHHDCHT